MAYEAYQPLEGVIQNITQEENDCCSQRVTLRTNDGITNFIVSPETMVVDSVRLRIGMRAAFFYDTTQPVPRIYPPLYRAVLATALGRNQKVVLNHFDGNLMAADGSLALNIGRFTNIVTMNGQRFRCSPADQTLLVYYSVETASLPPQTTPEKIVVMCQL